MEKTRKIICYFFTKEMFIFFIITLLFFGIYARLNYALDTYCVFSDSAEVTSLHFASCGRFITALATILTIDKIGNSTVYILSFILAVLFTILSIYELYNIIKKDVKNYFLGILIPTLIIINPFSIELFFYIEKSIMMLSVLLCILSVKNTINFFENKNKKQFLISLLLMFLANCCYQGTVGLYATIVSVYILKYSKNIKDFLKNNIFVIVIYGIPAIINFLLIKLVGADARVNGQINILESIKKTLAGINEILIETYNIIPKGVFLFVILLFIFTIIYSIIKKKDKHKARYLLGLVYIAIVTIGVTIAPQLLQSTDSIWYTARSSYSIGAIVGLLFLYLALNFEVKKVLNVFLCTSCLVLLSLQLFSFYNITIDNHIVGAIDKEYAEKIINKINEYENNTNTKITKMSFYSDMNPTYTYPRIHTSKDVNTKAFANDWSTKSIIDYYSNRIFELVPKDEILENEIKEKDWDAFSDEQIIIKKDTIHICNF